MKTPEDAIEKWLQDYERSAGAAFTDRTRLESLLILKKGINDPAGLSDAERTLFNAALDAVERDIIKNPLQFTAEE